MAEGGIKISQLSVLENPGAKDYTIVVHDGHTFRSDLSSMAWLFSKGLYSTQSDLAALSASITKEFSDTISDVRSYMDSKDSDLQNLINASQTMLGNAIEGGIANANARMDEAEGRMEYIASVLNTISSLTDNQELLSSLVSMIEMLSSDEGKVSLERIFSNLNSISNEISSVEDVKEKVSALAMDQTMAFCGKNMVYSEGLKGDYNYFHDRNRFAGIPIPCLISTFEYWYRGYLSSQHEDPDENIDTTPTLHAFPQPYDGGKFSMDSKECILLKNVDGTRMAPDDAVSAYSMSADADNRILSVAVNMAAVGHPTSEPEFFNYEGESDYAFVPVRAGMLSVRTLFDSYGNPTEKAEKISLKAIVRGNSDVGLYLNDAAILNGYNVKISIRDGFGQVIAKRKTTDKAGALEDLGYVFHGSLSGGTAIEFALDDEITSIGGGTASISSTDITALVPLLCTYNLIGSIQSVSNRSEMAPLRIEPISVWNSSGEQSVVSYKADGGFTGDAYSISVSYAVGDDETRTIVGENALLIDNTFLSVGKTYFVEAAGTTEISTASRIQIIARNQYGDEVSSTTLNR